ncbi:MCE family protein [Nocardioides sp. CBS4Y-1]|uniref:MCE family protein n=2 Tax=Nocardioides acrostichi TaxID=2784339 RepID=A0A930V0K2_9ACTN|nr:MCE family protein [Nocardioides acrostichi]
MFLALALGSVWLTYAIFTKKFTDYDKVTLESSTLGLQLPPRGDVKVRGVIVGEVLDFAPTDDDSVDITLGIYPSEIDKIPADVTGSILPKTLFGEKYVALDIPQGSEPSQSDHLEPGATISQTKIATEVEAVLNDLYPLLRTVRPADLNMTLTALSNALEGRGEQLGQTLQTFDAYLKKLNPQLPALVEDLRLTAQVSDTYADVLPQVGRILRNTITTTTTLEDREAKLNDLFTNVTGFSNTTRQFLADNEQNLVRFGQVSVPQTTTLAQYAPEFGCLMRGLVNAGKLQAEAFRDFTLHIVLETLPNQPRGYTPADKPHYGENRGPTCLHLPNPPWSQNNPVRQQPNMDDGVDTPTGKGTDRVVPGFAQRASSAPGWVGSEQETDMFKALIAPGMGVEESDVPDLGPFLIGPMARGAEVDVQ